MSDVFSNGSNDQMPCHLGSRQKASLLCESFHDSLVCHQMCHLNKYCLLTSVYSFMCFQMALVTKYLVTFMLVMCYQMANYQMPCHLGSRQKAFLLRVMCFQMALMTKCLVT